MKKTVIALSAWFEIEKRVTDEDYELYVMKIHDADGVKTVILTKNQMKELKEAL